jgi:hypothetical protein
MTWTVLIIALATVAFGSAAYAGATNCDQRAATTASAHPSPGGAGIDSDPDVDLLAMHSSNASGQTAHR